MGQELNNFHPYLSGYDQGLPPFLLFLLVCMTLCFLLMCAVSFYLMRNLVNRRKTTCL